MSFSTKSPPASRSPSPIVSIPTSNDTSLLTQVGRIKPPVDIVVVGSCNIDIQCYVHLAPRYNETVIGNKFQISYGGKGGNVAVICAKLGATVGLVGRVGADNFGKDYILKLRRFNINVAHTYLSEEIATGVSIITVNDEGEYYSVVIPNANYNLTSTDILNSKSVFKGAKVCALSCEIPMETILETMLLCKEIGVETIILAVSGHMEKQYFELATIIIVNQRELEKATGDEVRSLPEVQESLEKLLSFGCEIAIATLGGRGAMFIEKHDAVNAKRVMIPSIDCPPDKSGAHEAFVGGLAYAIVHYKELEFHEKVKMACEIARETVKKYGSQDSYPFKKDILHIFPQEE